MGKGPNATMTYVYEVILLFKTDRQSFAPICGTTGNGNMVLLHETLLNTCLYVYFLGTDSDYGSGVCLKNDAYQRSHTTTFNHMLALLFAYDPVSTVFKGSHRLDKESGQPI